MNPPIELPPKSGDAGSSGLKAVQNGTDFLDKLLYTNLMPHFKSI
jgi:hypothetical protein